MLLVTAWVTSWVIACLLSTSTPFTVRDFLKEGVKGTWDSAPPNSATLFFCSKEPWVILKDITGLDFTVRLAQPFYWFEALDSVQTVSPLGLHTLAVDWQCPMVDELLQKASKLSMIRSPYRWLILNVTEGDHTDESCQDLASKISTNGSALAEGRAADADVVLVCRGVNSLILVDLWGPIAPTVLGRWSPDVGKRFGTNRSSPAMRRLAAGFNGYVLHTAFAVTYQDTYNHLSDGRQKDQDFLTKFNYEVLSAVAKTLNGTMKPSFTKDFGYKINGSWTGVIGQLVRGEAEIGGTALAMVHNRFPIITHLNYHTAAEAIFIFKEPPMSYIYNIFVLPFPLSLWLSTIGLLSLSALLLYVVVRVEEMVEVTDDSSLVDTSWKDVALFTVAAICQRGSNIEPRGLSSRSLALLLAFSTFFFYTSYAASIVALLQSTTTDIRHYKDFLGSQMKIGAHNISYVTNFIAVRLTDALVRPGNIGSADVLIFLAPVTMENNSNTDDPARRRVYVEKMTENGRRNPFMALNEGMTKMRSSYFAFLAGKAGIYETIGETFQQHEKCVLREVHNFLGVRDPQLTVSKRSTLAEVMRITLRMVQECGIRERQVQKFMPRKPVCVNRGGNFQSVSLMDCYAAFVILSVGLALSSFAFLVENISFCLFKQETVEPQSDKNNGNGKYF